MNSLVISFTLDIIDYFNVINDYGKVNYKYFNYVWKKKGFQEIFIYKDEIVITRWKAVEFVEEVIFLFKKLFLAKESRLDKAVSLFLLYKLYFTDSYAKILKIRVNNRDFAKFKEFVEEVTPVTEFQPIKFMFWHLVSEGAFMFVSRSYVLGLDIYTNKTGEQQEENAQIIDSMLFWKDLKKTVNELKSDLTDLKELDDLHTKAVACIHDSEPQTELMKSSEQIMNQMIKILGELPKPDKLNQQILQKTFPEYFEPRFKKILSKRQEMKQKAKNEDIIKEDTNLPSYRKSARHLVKKNVKESTDEESEDEKPQIYELGNNFHQKYIMNALGTSLKIVGNGEDLKVPIKYYE